MITNDLKISDIDTYISTFPAHVQETLEHLRQTIREAAPEAAEKINYGIPTFTLHGNLVHFAAYKTHFGFYPSPSGIKAFKEQLSGFETAKGTVKFPIDQPLPFDLITQIVRFRVGENLEKAKLK
ncbi:iron chaperone [Runella slithyformis]|uniref:YdhG-like domain-containing protein n=1 Tax=Runella slithyformis (strain ATCC 29530 / DSM 19594 / LMG 11500 / NCIMB 11436 / LSU 4) TaxID=761193 RepID=A0A7U3ZP16_RUNSL|nr:DUF1801 domain-containing protein [Runella slithyformis]AEI50745.1 Domain of unknown function DUF1801 [Runella slithyformis DSM 19594]